MRLVNKILYGLCIIAAIMFIVGMCQLPQTGGDVIPQGESQDEYNKRQQQIVITSNGFKIAMTGMGLGIIVICLIAYRTNVEEAEFYLEEAARQRRAQTRVAPLVEPNPIKQELVRITIEEPAQEQVKPPIQIYKPMELYPYPPRYHPRAPVPYPPRVRFLQ